MIFKVILLGLLFEVIFSNAQQSGYGLPQPQRPPNLYRSPSPSPSQPSPQNTYRTPSSPPSQPPPPPPPPPRPSQSYGAPSNPGSVRVELPSQPQQMEGMPYDFDWKVEDEESGNYFNHIETSDGQKTEGEYRVLLPDGRTQVVKFYDDGNGFNADVTYE
ncbi:UNVERIFIED_CONTAM: hypothetical protein RMT77_014738 [Armadillidium vulgare]